MIKANVHIPRQTPIPACSATAPMSTIGRKSGFQTSTQNEISQQRVIRETADRLKSQGKNVTLLAAASGGHDQSMIEEGIPNAIGWFSSLGGGDPWVPLAGAAGPTRTRVLGLNRVINPPGIPRGRLGPGTPRGLGPGSPIRRPGMNRPGG